MRLRKWNRSDVYIFIETGNSSAVVNVGGWLMKDNINGKFMNKDRAMYLAYDLIVLVSAL